MEIRSFISNNPHLSVRSSVSCDVLVFVSSFPCDGKRMELSVALLFLEKNVSVRSTGLDFLLRFGLLNVT